MRKEDKAIIVLWVFALLVAAWASYKTLQLLAELGPALIAAAATVIAAILTHVFTEIRQQRLEQQKQKQQNYENLLLKVSKYVRNPENKDDLDTAHLYSWVVGSEEVIRNTQTFTNEKDDESLRSLLNSMRTDIGLDKIPKSINPEVFKLPAGGVLVSSKKIDGES